MRRSLYRQLEDSLDIWSSKVTVVSIQTPKSFTTAIKWAINFISQVFIGKVLSLFTNFQKCFVVPSVEQDLEKKEGRRSRY